MAGGRSILVANSKELQIKLPAEEHTLVFRDGKVVKKDGSSLSGDIESFDALLGCLPLRNTSLLVLVKKTTRVGEVLGHSVFKVDDTKVFQTDPSVKLTADEQRFSRLLTGALNLPGLYYSPTTDLSASLQRKHTKGGEAVSKNFLWNGFLSESLTSMAAAGIAAVLQSATAKLICGFVEANMDVQVGDKTINLYLVSRRSVKRAGTRLHRRGVDDNGDVANFVETEMITEMGSGDKKVVNAFLQTRGSIPIIWKQDPNMKWNPTPKRDGSDEKDHSLFSTHMKDTVRAYGKQVIIDLIDQKGKELIIGDAFRQNVDKLGSEDVRYVDFDFHKRCKKMNYTPLNELVDEVKEEFIQQGQFTLRGGKVDNVQKGVFRTNCKDCLDRTNVVQTKFARVNLATQLHVSGMLDAAHGIHDEPALEKVFKMMWADNADAISTQYSGTGALKNDFTRTGKRTKKGLLQDGVNSVTRYVLNNFYDGQRQDMYDLFLGNYVVPDQSSSPFSPVGGPQMLMMWFAAVLGLSLLLFTVTSQQAEASGSSFPFNVLPAFTAIGVFVVAMFGAFKVGSLFVDKPHLS